MDRGIDKIANYLNGTDTHENESEVRHSLSLSLLMAASLLLTFGRMWSQDVQFALAVKVHLYPNKIISVWVLMLSMIKR